MYLLALDESGTHGSAPVMIVGGIAVHETDVRNLESTLEVVIDSYLKPLGLNPADFELHAGEIRSPSGPRAARGNYKAQPASPWNAVPPPIRAAVLNDTYDQIVAFTPADADHPPAIFASIIDQRHNQFRRREERSYQHVLHRFDEFLGRRSTAEHPQTGIVIHDTRTTEERHIQDRARAWRTGTGKLANLIQTPLFADSKSNRVLQVADFVTYALWRYYSQAADDQWSSKLWPMAATDGTVLSGTIHLTPDQRTGKCTCPPCTSRPAK